MASKKPLGSWWPFHRICAACWRRLSCIKIFQAFSSLLCPTLTDLIQKLFFDRSWEFRVLGFTHRHVEDSRVLAVTPGAKLKNGLSRDCVGQLMKIDHKCILTVPEQNLIYMLHDILCAQLGTTLKLRLCSSCHDARSWSTGCVCFMGLAHLYSTSIHITRAKFLWDFEATTLWLPNVAPLSSGPMYEHLVQAVFQVRLRVPMCSFQKRSKTSKNQGQTRSKELSQHP